MTEIYPGCYRGQTASGLTVLAEPMPHLNSVSVGLWVPADATTRLKRQGWLTSSST